MPDAQPKPTATDEVRRIARREALRPRALFGYLLMAVVANGVVQGLIAVSR